MYVEQKKKREQKRNEKVSLCVSECTTANSAFSA